PAWLFDIDSLSQTMNYHPVFAENQSNHTAGFQDTEKAREEGNQTYVLFPMLFDGSTNPKNNKNAHTGGNEHNDDIQKSVSPDIHSSSCGDQSREQGDKAMNKDKGKNPVVTITAFRDLNEEFVECINNSSNGVSAAGPSVFATGLDFINNTNDFTAAGPLVSATELNFTNSTNNFSAAGPSNATRSMARGVRDQGGILQMFNEDFHTCMFTYFLSQEEPKRIHQALKDPSWIEAMQEELLQFKMQKVWILVDLPYRKREIATMAACQGIWLRRLLTNLTGQNIPPVIMHVDNRSALDLMKNPVFHGRSKHIDIRFHFIRECVENGEITVTHVSGKKQKADLLTKPLLRVKHQEMRDLIRVREIGSSELRGEMHEAKFIKKIVQEISLDLRSINFGFDEKLVGMETRVKDVVSSLEVGIDEVRMIGIKGMGGAGKTTTARAVFDHLSDDFEAKSFVKNVREVSNGSVSGLKKLQEQVLSDVLSVQVTLHNVDDGKDMMKRRMFGKKILLVLDDVDHIDQLEALSGGPNWFKPGSRIIVTTRDEQVLVAHRLNLIRDIDLLSKQEAICLFSRYAFGTENPLQGYEEVSGKVVRYAAGLPLTIKVLGSFLCGKKKKDAITILESCGFHARIGLKVLEQRSLITTSNYHQHLEMHDHIEEMGKNIVRREHPDEPNKHSRLWIKEEIEDILANDMGTEETRCLILGMSKGNSRILMKGLGKMKKLRYLEVYFAIKGNWESDGESPGSDR
nr:Toll/interleukin-1 receptor (TIR) domain-containing protein [Tanacetum cinerariifolium]